MTPAKNATPVPRRHQAVSLPDYFFAAGIDNQPAPSNHRAPWKETNMILFKHGDGVILLFAWPVVLSDKQKDSCEAVTRAEAVQRFGEPSVLEAEQTGWSLVK